MAKMDDLLAEARKGSADAMMSPLTEMQLMLLQYKLIAAGEVAGDAVTHDFVAEDE